jgi:hypothetical protein
LPSRINPEILFKIRYKQLRQDAQSRVADCRIVGKSATVGHYAFHVTYPIQFEGYSEETEELTIAEVLAGHRLYEDYRSRI